MFGGIEGGLLLVGAAGSRLRKQDNTKMGILQQRLEQQVTNCFWNQSLPSLDGFIDTIQLARFHMAWVFKIILHYVIKVKGDSGRTDNLGNWAAFAYLGSLQVDDEFFRWTVLFSIASVACCLNTEITQLSVEWISESPAFGIPRIVSCKQKFLK